MAGPQTPSPWRSGCFWAFVAVIALIVLVKVLFGQNGLLLDR